MDSDMYRVPFTSTPGSEVRFLGTPEENGTRPNQLTLHQFLIRCRSWADRVGTVPDCDCALVPAYTAD